MTELKENGLEIKTTEEIDLLYVFEEKLEGYEKWVSVDSIIGLRNSSISTVEGLIRELEAKDE